MSSINYDDLFLKINYYLLAEIEFKYLLEYDEDNDKYTKRKEITNQRITITEFPYEKKYDFLLKLVEDFIKNSKNNNGNIFKNTNGTMKSNEEQIKAINDLIKNNKKKDYINMFNDPQSLFIYP